MFVATASRPLATTITGSLPRPTWYVQNLGTRPFLTAFNGDAMFREQYVDAVEDRGDLCFLLGRG